LHCVNFASDSALFSTLSESTQILVNIPPVCLKH
jgi:hypothetical protein